jgi:hypothetical protein
MSASEVACICLGVFCNVLTFFLGTAVGITMARTWQNAAPGRDRQQRGQQ